MTSPMKTAPKKRWSRDRFRRPAPTRYGEWYWDQDRNTWECRLNARGRRRVEGWMEKYGSLTNLIRKLPHTRRMYAYAESFGFDMEQIEGIAQRFLCAAVARYRPRVNGKPIQLITYVAQWMQHAMGVAIRRRRGEPTPNAVQSLNAEDRDGDPFRESLHDAKALDPANQADPLALRDVRRALDQLPARSRDIFLRRTYGEGYVPIGASWGISKNRAQQIVQESREKLRTMLGLSNSIAVVQD